VAHSYIIDGTEDNDKRFHGISLLWTLRPEKRSQY